MRALARSIPSRITIEVSGAVVAGLAVIIVLAAVDNGPGASFGDEYASASASGSGSAIALAIYFMVASAGAAVVAIRQRDPTVRLLAASVGAGLTLCPRGSGDLLGRRRASSRSPTVAAGCSGTLSKRQ